MAVKLSIDDVQHMTSNATHVSHSASPSLQMAPATYDEKKIVSVASDRRQKITDVIQAI